MALKQSTKDNIKNQFEQAEKILETITYSGMLKDYFEKLEINITSVSTQKPPNTPKQLDKELTYDTAKKMKEKGFDRIKAHLGKKINEATEFIQKGLNEFESSRTEREKKNTKSLSNKAVKSIKALINPLKQLDDNGIRQKYPDAKKSLENLKKAFRKSALVDFRDTLNEILYVIANSIYYAIYFLNEELKNYIEQAKADIKITRENNQIYIKLIPRDNKTKLWDDRVNDYLDLNNTLNQLQNENYIESITKYDSANHTWICKLKPIQQTDNNKNKKTRQNPKNKIDPPEEKIRKILNNKLKTNCPVNNENPIKIEQIRIENSTS